MIRPDRYILGVASSAAELGALLSERLLPLSSELAAPLQTAFDG